MSEDRKVIVTRGFVGICHMQVCAAADATDEEILRVCNSENPAGTTNGWGRVLRADDEHGQGPAHCEKFPERLHLLVAC